MRPDDSTRYASTIERQPARHRPDDSTRQARPHHRGNPGRLFDLLHQGMHEQLEAETRPGLLVFAASGDLGLVGSLWLEAGDAIRGGTIGRHEKADLSLPWDDTLSLRHVLVLVRKEERRTHVRVLDLRTENGLFDERGEPVTCLEADGPLVVGASGWWFFLFPTGVAVPWDANAVSPWATLPERAFTQRRWQPSVASRFSLKALWRSDATLVATSQGPVSIGSGELLEPGERSEGLLHLECGGVQLSVAVGKGALERGVLLGRDVRCDGASILEDRRISRVHAVLMRDHEGQLVLLDVGSTNGTWSGDEGRLLRRLRLGTSVTLAGAARLRWQPAKSEGAHHA